jgi:hypothetical protein
MPASSVPTLEWTTHRGETHHLERVRVVSSSACGGVAARGFGEHVDQV